MAYTAFIDCDNKDLSAKAIFNLLLRDADCNPIIDCDNKDESWKSHINRVVSVAPDGSLALNICGDLCPEG